MALFKGTAIGLGSLAVLMVVWKLVVGAFVVGIVLLKIVFFIVVPILLLMWIANKVLANGSRTETTGM
jgi:hypothetical protein